MIEARSVKVKKTIDFSLNNDMPRGGRCMYDIKIPMENHLR